MKHINRTNVFVLTLYIRGRPRSQGAEFPAQKSGRSSRRVASRTNGKCGKIELDPIRTDERQRRTYGNGNVIFYVSYEIRTDERNSYVLLQRQRLNCTDTECWKSGVWQ